MIHTGRMASLIAAPTREEEWHKLLLSALMAGRGIIGFDEVSELRSAALASALTQDPFEGRILGQSKLVEVPQRATWAAAGNNVRITGPDMPRRCYWVRMDAERARPWERDGFRHDPLLGWAQVHRWDLLCACLRERRQAQIHTPHDGATAEVEQPLLRSGSGTRPRRSDGRRSRASAVKGRSPDGSEDRGQRTSGGRGREVQKSQKSPQFAPAHTHPRSSAQPNYHNICNFCTSARPREVRRTDVRVATGPSRRRRSWSGAATDSDSNRPRPSETNHHSHSPPQRHAQRPS